MFSVHFLANRLAFSLLLCTFLSFHFENANGQTVNTLPLNNVNLCACSQITIGYAATGVYLPGNVFSVQLSDAVGNFVGATIIGTLPGTALNGVIVCTIPCNTPYGTGYRVRTISSMPVAGGPNNGVDITIKPSPVASISFSTFNCIDTLTANAAGGQIPVYSYLWSTGATTSKIIPSSTGVYTVTVTSDGCSDTATYNYQAPPAPSVSISSTGIICSGNLMTLDAGAGFSTYLWDDASTAQTRTVAAGGTYYVTVSNAQGCLGSDTITVYADTTVQANFTAVMHYGCDNDTVFVTNNSTGGTQFNWLFGDGGYSTFQNPQPYVYVNQGNFNITLIVGNPPCFDTMTIPIVINHSVDATFTLAVNGGNTVDSVCLSNPPNVFVATPVQNQPLWTIEWNWGDGSPTDNAPISIHQYTTPGIYTLIHKVTDTLGCVDSSTHIIFVGPPAFVIMHATDSIICVGEKISFSDSLSIFTQSFFYDFGDGYRLDNIHNPTHTWDLPGTYIVKLNTTYHFCPDDSTSLQIEVEPYPVINLGKDTSICPGVTGSVLISDVNNPATLYDWSTGESSNSIVVTEPGLYWATSKAACATTDSIMIWRDCFINIPNAFSPDGDGLNDYFFPRDLLSAGVTSFKMNIYNRWGEQLFTAAQMDGRGWDGKYNGVLQPTSTYVYTIEVEFSGAMKKIFKGNVILVR